ncbi:MAG: SOS response-associated peptidase [Gammaproteobacteria bacterium]|nr:SOS response-associated peptidase [Gammaproteobacteria bacterium]
MINARSETVISKPAFRDSYKYRRCLVAADGWYEWKVTPAAKVPTFIHRITADGEIALFFFAGLWASWYDKGTPDAEPLETFTILTRDASPALAEVHDRMPVILPQGAYSAWLDRRVTRIRSRERSPNHGRPGRLPRLPGVDADQESQER